MTAIALAWPNRECTASDCCQQRQASGVERRVQWDWCSDSASLYDTGQAARPL